MSKNPQTAIVRTSESPHLRPFARVRDIWAFREILLNLVRMELKVKYTKSVLGAAWSMLNPILYLAVFSFVFAYVLPADIPAFPVYLLSGLIAWNFFSGALTLSSRAVVDNTTAWSRRSTSPARSCRSRRWERPWSTSWIASTNVQMCTVRPPPAVVRLVISKNFP